jgi:hypothetical protein
LVACAFTSGFEIGIDVERIRQSRFDVEVTRNCFSVEACRDILEAPERLQPERFFDYWVLVEAFAKARGTSLLPASGSFVFGNADRSYIRFIPSQAKDYALSFWLFEPALEYRMAVAMAGEPSGAPIVRRLGRDGSHDMVCRADASNATFRST